MNTLPTDPVELDALASEYVLGTLDARSARTVAAAVGHDAEMTRLVHEWEQRLAPLSSLAIPEAPPEGLWDRIDQAIAPALNTKAALPAPAGRRFWQGWAIAATLVAAGLAAVMILPQPAAQPGMMTVLLSDANQTAWTAQVDPRGEIHLAALSSAGGATVNTAPPDNKVLELWALPPGAKAPTSLGLVPRGQSQVNLEQPRVRPVPGMLILISLEPPGGAPNGSPTGPVLFVGKLSPAGPAI